MNREPIHVTGMGAVSPAGVGLQAFWDGINDTTRERDSWVAPIQSSDILTYKEARRADRFQMLAIAAADEAIQQSGVSEVDPSRVGVLIGNWAGGYVTNAEQILKWSEQGEAQVSPLLIPMMMGNAAPSSISIRHGFTGTCHTVGTACASGATAILEALWWLWTGRCDVVIAGGAEAPIHPVPIAAFKNMGALSPQEQLRPFAEQRDGFVLAEGAGLLVLETASHAQQRGATPQGTVLGGASTSDADHVTAPSGVGAVQCMRAALHDSGLTPESVAAVNAHGTGTPLNDSTEMSALRTVFASVPPVLSIKGTTGHSIAAGGALEAIASFLAMTHRVLPPTVGAEPVDPQFADLDVVTCARGWDPAAVLSNSFGFGGHNVSLIFSPAHQADAGHPR